MANEDHLNGIPPALRKLFSKPPIIAGEDPTAYQLLLELIIDEVQPKTASEWLLARDIADAEWELLRLKGFKAGIVNLGIRASLERALGPSKEPRLSSREIMEELISGNNHVHSALKMLAPQVSLDDLAVAIFEDRMPSQLNSDRMLDAALRRRTGAYAELDRLRSRKSAPRQYAVDAPPTQPTNSLNGHNGVPAGSAANDPSVDAAQAK
jgi:hypothetical protein